MTDTTQSNVATSGSTNDEQLTNINQQTITTYVDDHTNVVNDEQFLTNPSQINSVDTRHDINEFLKRPALINTLSLQDSGSILPITNLEGSNELKSLLTVPFPSTLIAVPSKTEKLSRFKYLKADIHLKLTINASPLVTGKFLLVYAPYEDSVDDSRKLIR